MIARLIIKVFRSHALFLLVYHPQIKHLLLQEKLINAGVYVRDCSSFLSLSPYHSRVSVRLRNENRVLILVKRF